MISTIADIVYLTITDFKLRVLVWTLKNVLFFLGHWILCQVELMDGLISWWLLLAVIFFVFSFARTSTLDFKYWFHLTMLMCYCRHHRICIICFLDQVIWQLMICQRQGLLLPFRLGWQSVDKCSSENAGFFCFQSSAWVISNHL